MRKIFCDSKNEAETRELLIDAEKIVKRILGNSFSHGYPHVFRVRNIAWKIVEVEKLQVDPLVLDLAVILHDAGRGLGDPHALYSAYFAEGFLRNKGLCDEKLSIIINAILYHSYSYARKHGIQPLSVEAKVLSDADKLDALGTVGFLRVFLHGQEYGRSYEDSLQHFDEKIFRLKELLHFEYSRRLAKKLEERTRIILRWLEEEVSDDIID
ncbi:MAG: phosphohydrolase [Thermoprotei archaeon]|nr:MAG: phosphohydrolase [Thermoprotei archaeon]